jgi:hypothetical protein
MPESVVYHAFEETLQYWKDEGGGMAQGKMFIEMEIPVLVSVYRFRRVLPRDVGSR